MDTQSFQEILAALNAAGKASARGKPAPRVMVFAVMGRTFEIPLERLKQTCVLCLAALPLVCFLWFLLPGDSAPRAAAAGEPAVEAIIPAADEHRAIAGDPARTPGSAAGSAPVLEGSLPCPAATGESVRAALLSGNDSGLVNLRTREEEEIFSQWGDLAGGDDQGLIIIREDGDRGDIREYRILMGSRTPVGTVDLKRDEAGFRIVGARPWLDAAERRAAGEARGALVAAVEEEIRRSAEDLAVLEEISTALP